MLALTHPSHRNHRGLAALHFHLRDHAVHQLLKMQENVSAHVRGSHRACRTHDGYPRHLHLLAPSAPWFLGNVFRQFTHFFHPSHPSRISPDAGIYFNAHTTRNQAEIDSRLRVFPYVREGRT